MLCNRCEKTAWEGKKKIRQEKLYIREKERNLDRRVNGLFFGRKCKGGSMRMCERKKEK
jgi:hypothetical protein